MRYTSLSQLLVFGLPFTLGTSVGIYAATSSALIPALCSFGFAATTLIIFAILTITKYINLQKFNIALNHGIYVNLNGYHTTPDILNAEVERMLTLYSNAVPHAKLLLEETPVCCTFIPGVFQADGMTVAGLTTSDTIQVSYYTRDANNKCIVDADIGIMNTAFAHELGHIILQRDSPGSGMDEQHTFMRNHNLP